jgi:hypothetical protein
MTSTDYQEPDHQAAVDKLLAACSDGPGPNARSMVVTVPPPAGSGARRRRVTADGWRANASRTRSRPPTSGASQSLPRLRRTRARSL